MVKLSKPTLSTTVKNSPFAACFNALIKKASGACVIAVLNKAKELLLFLCPVKSLKLFGYTAIEGFTFAGNKFLSSSDCKSNIALVSIFFVNAKSLFSFNTAQLESKITDRQRNCRNISILVRYS